jgi:hypothetical protein
VIARAAAEVAGECFTNPFGCWARLAVEQRFGGDEDAGRAVAALRRTAIREFLLQRMQPPVLDEALDRQDVAPIAFGREREAREHGIAVEQHRACAALAQLAAVFRPGELQILAQDLEQRLVGVDEYVDALAVHGHGQSEFVGHLASTARTSNPAI